MLHGKRLVAAIALFLLSGAPVDYAQREAGAYPPGGPIDWRNAPEYVSLFTPVRAHAGAYHVYVSPLDLTTVLRKLEDDLSLLRPPGAWMPAAQLPSDAFGQTGSYDRWKMAKLYGASRAMVARGPRADGERPYEAWTLISPYPDLNLERLEPGTLLIVLDLQGQ